MKGAGKRYSSHKFGALLSAWYNIFSPKSISNIVLKSEKDYMQAPALFDTGHRADFVAAIFLAVANDVSERQKGLHGTRSTRVTTRRGRSVIRTYFFLYSEQCSKIKSERLFRLRASFNKGSLPRYTPTVCRSLYYISRLLTND